MLNMAGSLLKKVTLKIGNGQRAAPKTLGTPPVTSKSTDFTVSDVNLYGPRGGGCQ
jgi:hypothetical protein